MIDRQTVRLLRQRMQAALDPLGVELKVKFVVGNASYTNDNVRFKVEALLVQPNGEVVDEAAASFKRLAHRFGLKPTDLGREFAMKGKQFVVTGLMPRSHRYPILARSTRDGKVWKLSAADVLEALGA
jgi:hypothetical protein